MADSSGPPNGRVQQLQSSTQKSQSPSGAEGNSQNPANLDPSSAAATNVKPKKKKHRGGKRRKNRRQSFLAPSEATEDTTDGGEYRPSLADARTSASQQVSFYRLQTRDRRSNTSLESEALLDHRGQGPSRSRRETFKSGLARVTMPFHRHNTDSANESPSAGMRSRLATAPQLSIGNYDDDEDNAHDRTPLLGDRERSTPHLSRNNSGLGTYGSHGASHKGGRRASNNSKASSRRRFMVSTTAHNNIEGPHDVNNPPSVPGSPTLGSLDDIFMAGANSERGRDAVVDFVSADLDSRYSDSPEGRRRRPTLAEIAERDVCFPVHEEGSDHAIEEEEYRETHRSHSRRPRRRRARIWPDLEVLEEWSREEKEERTQQDLQRAKKISEPVLVGGRLRPTRTTEWHREEDDAPFRFTYFNETLDGTIHARSISDLQDDITFRELFTPDPVELSDDSDDDDDETDIQETNTVERPPLRGPRASNESNRKPSESVGHTSPKPREMSQARTASIVSKSRVGSAPGSGDATPRAPRKRYGDPPTFWLDVLCPTEAEMKVLSKAFGIHQLTAEDILMDEPREKVELFPSYYFVNYRTFEQDKDSEDYMDGINIYVIVFKSGVITFHHSMSPHPANVRRRIRQLNDYMSPTPDWISYAMIDDITDVYLPRVTQIEGEVDEIDEDILYMHTTAADLVTGSQQKKDSRPKSSKGGKQNSEKESKSQADMGAMKTDGDDTTGESGGATLRRIGVCRKKVMQLYRLLGNKADVIKGFAKRCNEQHQVAPRSDIGLYLGDIQDHIVTMNSSLAHFESLLSRAHNNYMAQISIRMNERTEQNADVLGKLTVLGTIVLPMNIITGMWGMNVWVPGQEYEGDLTWFFCITAGLVAFGLTCYFVAKRVYGIM